MRIANNKIRLGQKMTGTHTAALLICGALSLAFTTAAYAGPMPMPSGGVAPVQSVTPAPAPSAIPSPTGSPPTLSAPPVMPIPSPLAAAPVAPQPGNALAQAQATKIDTGSADIGKSVTSIEDKASTDAKSIIKHLDLSSESVTLDDLNAARQAVVRLDAMIEVEKHLGELEKMRADRSGSSGSHGMAGTIPASALMPPASPMGSMPISAMPVLQPKTENEPRVVEKPKPSSSNVEVSRISGADGIYAAVLKLDDGSLKVVKTGDHVTDHMVVRSISPSSVAVDVNGETRNLRVKNIDAIYSAMR